MTDYTPSTDAVRKVYAAAPIVHEANRLADADVARNTERFYRWLAAVQADAFDRGAKAQADGYGMQVDTINPYKEHTA